MTSSSRDPPLQCKKPWKCQWASIWSSQSPNTSPLRRTQWEEHNTTDFVHHLFKTIDEGGHFFKPWKNIDIFPVTKTAQHLTVLFNAVKRTVFPPFHFHRHTWQLSTHNLGTFDTHLLCAAEKYQASVWKTAIISSSTQEFVAAKKFRTRHEVLFLTFFFSLSNAHPVTSYF